MYLVASGELSDKVRSNVVLLFHKGLEDGFKSNKKEFDDNVITQIAKEIEMGLFQKFQSEKLSSSSYSQKALSIKEHLAVLFFVFVFCFDLDLFYSISYMTY